MALMINAAGGSVMLPIVIWKSGDILLDIILSKVNCHLSTQGRRSVSLLMDNAGCYPAEIKDKYSNLEI